MVRHSPGIVARAAYFAEQEARAAERQAAREAETARRRAAALKGIAARRARLAASRSAETSAGRLLELHLGPVAPSSASTKADALEQGTAAPARAAN